MNGSLLDFANGLPIHEFYDRITAAVDANQITIITAETGAGKSTQVPQYLIEHGYRKVIVTQPRILAARNLAHRVRDEWAERTGHADTTEVGYRTAHERDDDPANKILYCTDGLQLVRELTGSGTGDGQVLILDEVHEWNENMEVLIAWAKKRAESDPRFKIVIMSATIETDSLAKFLHTTAVITVPGRSFEITWRRGTDVLSEVATQIATGRHNVLVFLPGKAEIQDVIEALGAKAQAAGIPLIPLHSQLEAADQQQAFGSYPKGKIILATNIAQTSVTIDDIDVVIDSGLERRSEVRSGVEGLFIAQISQADCLQRAGRAGRTKPGEYILAQYGAMPYLPFDKRQPYATPEILRKHIDRLTLRLANIGIDIEQLDFFHDPSHSAITRAKQTLIALGALTRDNTVTHIGKLMEQFPVESSYGRMLVEAQSYSPEVQTKLAAIIGIQEVGGIVKGGTRYTGWRAYTKQTKSDLLAQYDVYLALPQIIEEEYDELGIIGKNVDKANEVMERLESDLRLDHALLTPVTTGEEEQLRRCIVAGQIDRLWYMDLPGEVVHLSSGQRRELSSSTVVRRPRLLTGTPFDLQVPTRSGVLETLHLLNEVTIVDARWLEELAPGQFTLERSKAVFDPFVGRLVARQRIRIGGKHYEGDSVPLSAEAHPNEPFYELVAQWAFDEIETERDGLIRKGQRHVPSVPLKRLSAQMKAIIGKARSFDELSPNERQQAINLARLQTHIGSGLMSHLRALPHRGNGGRRHGWKPKHKRRDS